MTLIGIAIALFGLVLAAMHMAHGNGFYAVVALVCAAINAGLAYTNWQGRRA